MKRKLSIFMAVCLCICSILFVPVTDNTAYAASISLNKTSATIVNGKTVQLKVKGTSAKVKWSTSSKSIATVSTKGLVKAKKPGRVTITAKVANKTLKCKVTVKKNTNDYYGIIKKDLLSNADNDGNGNYTINGYANRTNDWLGDYLETVSVTYNSEYNYYEFKFSQEYHDYDWPAVYVTMTVKEPFDKAVDLHVEHFYFWDDYTKACYMANGKVNASTYYDGQELYPFITQKSNSTISISQHEATIWYNIAMYSWDIMIYQFFDIDKMARLGFTNFP